MRDKKVKCSGDIGSGWYTTLFDDGSATVRNVEKGQRIDLPAESVKRFNEIWDDSKDAISSKTSEKEG